VVGPVKIAGGPDPGLEARTLVWVAGVAAIVLLVACANVANLFLARSLRRRREVALRLALGVGRRRLAAQAFTEAFMLSLIGCAVGVGIAQWGGLALRRLFIPGATSVDLFTDWRTLGAAAAAALGAALVTSVAPLTFARRADLTTALKAGVREGTHQRSGLRSALLVLQSALSVVLLVGAGLFVRSLDRVRSIPLGYDVERVLYVRWESRGLELDSARHWALRRGVMDGALAIPGVERAAWVGGVPFQRGTSIMNGLLVQGIDSVARLGRFTFQMASDDYFATVGTRILRGRGFTAADGPGAPSVVVVSEAMARTLWPGENALGRCITIIFRSPVEDAKICRTVVGVAENVVHDPVADLPLRYYVPEAQFDLSVSTMLLKLSGDPGVEGERIRRAVQVLLPAQAHVSALPARDMVDVKLRSWNVGATMFVAFGVLALLVAAVGLYGVVSYNVGQRMHELAVRMALGAQRGRVLRLVVGQGVLVAVIGVMVGSGLALGAAGFVQPLLYRQEARDPLVFATVGVVLVLVAVLASLWPGVRAVRVDPGSVLRSD
jgi:predicted permease